MDKIEVINSTFLVCIIMYMFIMSGCDVFVSDGTTVRGTVTDAETGEPLADIYITLSTNGGSVPDFPIAETETSSDGVYELSANHSRAGTVTVRYNYGSISDNGEVIPSVNNYCTYVQTVPRGENDLDVELINGCK